MATEPKIFECTAMDFINIVWNGVMQCLWRPVECTDPGVQNAARYFNGTILNEKIEPWIERLWGANTKKSGSWNGVAP